MLTNQTEKPSWRIDAELRLNRLESDTLAVRKKVDAIYESEIQTLNQRRVDLQYRTQSLTATNRDKRIDNTVRLASAQQELDSVNAAYSAAQERYYAAEAEAKAAIRILDRAHTAWRKVGGGMSLGFELFKA